MNKWFKKSVFGVVLLVGVLLVLGITYEQISRHNADQDLQAHGELVDVGGHKLHFYKQGTTGPTVVFESAFDPVGHLQWFYLQKQLSAFATTFSYDRAGLLWSERGNNPKTGKYMAKELHTLLEKAKAPKPYILVGHSLGGLILRSFVTDYQRDVAGVILVDSKHPNEQKFMSQQLYDLTNAGLPGAFLKFANSVGLLRQMFKGTFPNTQEYDYQNALIPALLFKSASAILEEQEQLPLLYEQARKITSFGDMPLIVMSATDRDRFDALFDDDKLKFELIEALTQMQLDLLNLSTDSEQILVPNSGHYINEDQPQAIINAVKKMMSKTKQ